MSDQLPDVETTALSSWGDASLIEAIGMCLSDDSKDGFLQEVEMWSCVIDELPAFEESDIRKQLDNLDIESMNPRSMAVIDTGQIVETYFHVIRYRNTLADLTNLVQPHADTVDGAIKSLKDTARLQAVGTDKDKDARATATIRPLTVKSVRIKRLLNAIKEKKETADYIRRCLEKIVDERRNDAYINQKMFMNGSALSADIQPSIDNDDDDNIPAEYRKKS